MYAPNAAPSDSSFMSSTKFASGVFTVACLSVVLALTAWLWERSAPHNESYVERAYRQATSAEVQGDFLAAGYRATVKKGFYDVSITAVCDRQAELKSVPCGDIPNVPFKVTVEGAKHDSKLVVIRF